jgi:hypothetical protein
MTRSSEAIAALDAAEREVAARHPLTAAYRAHSRAMDRLAARKARRPPLTWVGRGDFHASRNGLTA